MYMQIEEAMVHAPQADLHKRSVVLRNGFRVPCHGADEEAAIVFSRRLAHGMQA
jgi:hypothetical protein